MTPRACPLPAVPRGGALSFRGATVAGERVAGFSGREQG